MAIWIQSLSWTLIYALVQGCIVFVALRVLLRLMPALPAAVKYHLSLAAMGGLFLWFAGTWWQQYHYFAAMVSAPVTVLAAVAPGTAVPAGAGEGQLSLFLYQAQRVLPWLSVCYVAGLLFMLVRLCTGVGQLLPMKKKGTAAAGEQLNGLLPVLKDKLRYSGPVQLLISAQAKVPMVIGFLKPVILLPAATAAQLSMEQLETILLHELAHIKRNDYLVNILQTVVETVLFFNPFVWKISAMVRREREYCCDDLVMGHTQEPLSYATALASLAGADTPALAMAATGQDYPLYERIERIMEAKKKQPGYGRVIAAGITGVLIAVCAVAVTSSFTRPDKNPKAAQVNAKESVPPATTITEEELLIQRLEDARLVDEVTGFLVEKNGNKLYINGAEQPQSVADKCLPSLSKPYIRVQIFSLEERMKMHPDAGFLQVLMPMKMSSGCVQTSAKPGC